MSRSFLDLDAVDGHELRAILARAAAFKAGDPARPMAGKMLAMIFDKPSTRWPDFRQDTPPRPAVIAITRKDGGPIGG